MRTNVTAGAVCLALGAMVVVGCSGGSGDTADAADSTVRADSRSAEQLLDEANRTMKALTSVTIVSDTVTSLGNRYSARLTTDLKSRCTLKASWSYGSEMEQVRIGDTDYIHPNDVYLEMWGRKTEPEMRQKPWLKSPTSAAKGADELSDCTWPFIAFGTGTKGEPTEVDGKPVIPVEVTDTEVADGTYTYFVAAEGRPYLLKVTFEGDHHVTMTEFSGFDEPLDIQPPPASDVLDIGAGD
ncbi:hypothetical protein [Streptomyces sp. NPDC018693]|uniref:hypothetical protein n=1 Tax=unclassified Streptomyces TaxID=2593676 RepID=UPI0037BCCF5A